MIHPDTELRFISHDIGYGVVAKRLIPKGTITWVRDDLDQVFTPTRLREMDAAYQSICKKYCFTDGKGHYILCWDLARFVNHSCEANCLSPGYNFEMAIRDIHPGEELTDDYGTLNPDESFTCLCGSKECRGDVGPNDVFSQADRWDAKVRNCFQLVGSLNQPLWELVREKRAVKQALSQPGLLASCRKHFRLLNQTRQTPMKLRAVG